MILSLDDDGLKLGNPPQPVPGFCTSASIGSKLIFDTAKTEGTNGQKYQLKGWEDGDISLSIRILGDDKKSMTDYLTEVVELFKKTDDNGAPIIYEIDMPIFRAWKITRTFFSGLQTNLTVGKQEFVGELKFREYKPEIDVIQENKQSQEDQGEEIPSPEIAPVYVSQDVIEMERLKTKMLERGLNV